MGTGKDRRILKEDIQHLVNTKLSGAAKSSSPQAKPLASPSPWPAPSTAVQTPAAFKQIPIPLSDRKEPLKGDTRAMIKSMTVANVRQVKNRWLTNKQTIDLSELIRLRKQFKRVPTCLPTYRPFFLKAASLAHYKFSILNSILDTANDVFIFKVWELIYCYCFPPTDNRNNLWVISYLGFSQYWSSNGYQAWVDIKNVQSKSVLDTAEELGRLQQLGPNWSLGPNELTGILDR